MNLNGIYRGFGPTDESGVALGELELTVGDDTISFRFATGLEIQSDEVSRSELRQLTADELVDHFEADASTDDITGYILGEEGAVFLFFPEMDEMPKAPQVTVLRFVSAEIDAIFGPVMLFTPQQVTAGHFNEALLAIETAQGDSGVIPRLANNGRRLPRS